MPGTAYGATISGDRMVQQTSSCPRLIFLTQFYDPEPAYKGQAFAEAVRDMGYEVEVVTGFPNYPGGKLYEGYRIRACKRTTANGIRITRLALFPSHGGSKIGRIANYLSFMLSAFIYLSFFAKRASLVYVYNPPLTVGLAAAASRLFRRRTPVIVDIHDLWPDTLPATGMISDHRVLGVIEHAANWMYRRVQFIILHTHGFRQRLIERGVPAKHMETVIGWTNEYPRHEIRPEGAERLAALPGLKLLYAGNMGPAQALDAVLNAAAILQRAGKAELASFCFMGGGISRGDLQQRAEDMGLANVTFLPRVAPDEVGAFLDSADALLVHLRVNSLFAITLPSKTQSYMYAGKPVVMGVSGEAARLIEEAQAGLCVRSEDPEDIARVVEHLALLPKVERNAMGQRGRSYYMKELSMEKGMKQFSDIFARVRAS